MDHKTWLWRKKSSEKAIVSSDKVNVHVKGNEEEIQTLLTDKQVLEKNLKIVNDKLSFVLSEINTKDELAKKHAKIAQEAIAGWEKTETEAVTLKHELDEAIHQRLVGEERIAHLNTALDECMQQLRFVREEQEQRIHDAVMKASREFEKSKMILEEKLAETDRKISKMGVKNSQLSKDLLMKEKVVGDLSRQLADVEANFNALMSRLESTEKDNTSLKYEVRVLEKEVEIRNEEREFNRRTAESSHKQHLESMKKIAKLESECQRLRLLVRKRLPGPAALAKMKNEVEMLGRDSLDMRRHSNPMRYVVDPAVDNSPETPKQLSILTEQLLILEEENKSLKEALTKKTDELQFSRIMFSRTASKLSQAESLLELSSKGQNITEPIRSSLTSQDPSRASMSDIGSDDKVSCAESWASALISELEHFRNGKQRCSTPCKTVGASDLSLMDDFVEMEKLAIVSVDPGGNSQTPSNEANAIASSFEAETNGCSSEIVASKTVNLSHNELHFSLPKEDFKSKNMLIGEAPSWLQDMLKVILEKSHIIQRTPDKILEDIRVALASMNRQKLENFVDSREDSNHPDDFPSPSINGNISREHSDVTSLVDSNIGLIDVDNSLTEKSKHQLQSNMSESVSKLIELIEGISLPSPDYGNSETLRKDENSMSEIPTSYVVRVFQWKSFELSDVLKQFLHTCYDMLSGKADLGKFVQELTTALEWILNHCFSLQDVSSMRDSIQKHLDWDESRSESEVEIGTTGHFSEVNKSSNPRDQLSHLNMTATSNSHSIQTEELKSNLTDEKRKLEEELINIESAKKNLEGRLQSAADTSESLTNQLQESDKTIGSLQNELETLKESKGVIEDRIENQKLMNQDVDSKLTAAKVELNESQQKSIIGEELQATCVDLQLQFERVTKKGIPCNDLPKEENKLRNEWEITAASEKLAECQETILNLGKQLKALAAPREAALFDKVIAAPSDTVATTTTLTSPKDKNTNQRSSLLDRMLAEDGTVAMDKYVKPSENGPLAIVPSKKQGGVSLWRKLLRRKKKVDGRKTPRLLAS